MIKPLQQAKIGFKAWKEIGERIEKDGCSALLFSEEHRLCVFLSALFWFEVVILTHKALRSDLKFVMFREREPDAYFIFSWNWCVLSQREANKHGTLKISLLRSCLSQTCCDLLWWVSALLSTTSQTKVRMGHERSSGQKSVIVDVLETSIDLLTYIHAIDWTSSSMFLVSS